MISGELVEVVDLDERVVEIVSRAEMRRRNLVHRATYVMVFDSHGSLLAHQRASWKDIWPSRWDLAFGGVCGVGEPWTDAAARELTEEAGIVAPLREVSNVVFDSDETRVVGRFYEATHDGPFEFADGEVVDHCWVPLPELDAWTTTHRLCDDTFAVVLPYVRERHTRAGNDA
ncbi:MAG TPA: NUDIX domain-containing protein [Acidimicrobiales bacterium]|nr:NUDIX domain-containing protein [Acidimicrobiales bacterium]